MPTTSTIASEHHKSIYRIDLNTAVEYTNAWRKDHIDGNLFTHAITVDVDELKEIIDELRQKTTNKLNAVRFYFGIKDYTFPPGNVNMVTCMVMVGVAGFEHADDLNSLPKNSGVDLTIYTEDDGSGELKTVSGCYDFTYPCPATCAIGSVLMGE